MREFYPCWSLKESLQGTVRKCYGLNSVPKRYVEILTPVPQNVALLDHIIGWLSVQFSSVQSLSHVQLFATAWTTAPQASLSITNSRSPPKLMSIESVSHPTISSSLVPFSSCPPSFPASGSFQMSQLFASGGQSTGVSASISVLPMNIQDWSPLGWTGWISLQSKGLSRVFSNTTIQKHQSFGAQLSL